MHFATHAQAVNANCVSSRFFYNKNVDQKQRLLEQNVTKSTAISWFCKNRAFQHIVPTLSYDQAPTNGGCQSFCS